MKKWKEGLLLLPTLVMGIIVAGAVFLNPSEFPEITYPEYSQEELQEEETQQEKENDEETPVEEKKVKKLRYQSEDSLKDGTYTGEGTGFGGRICVTVTIVKGKITNIVVTEHSQETPSYFAKAMAVVQRILEAQSPNVDTVSGATYSSNGIREAVIQALKKAGGKESAATVATKTTTTTTTKKTTTSKKTTKLPTGTPADGIYTGTAVCEQFGYDLSLKAKFKNGKAVALYSLKISNNADPANEAYWKKAWKPMVKRILKAQNSKVDVVSGATYSSNAVIAAYLDAREKAVSKNSKSTNKKSDSTNKKTEDDSDTVLDDPTVQNPTGQVTDGVYQVTALCEPDQNKAFASYYLMADVTFAHGKLTSIDNFTSTDESNRGFYLKAANGNAKDTGVVTQLLTKQSAAGISAVSGATCSSKTIRDLYLLALEKATGSKQDNSDDDMVLAPPANEDDTQNNNDQNNPTQEPSEDNSDVKDGTYTVTVTVWPDEWEEFWEYTLTADVTFQGGKLISIDNMVISDNSNLGYCTLAANGTSKKEGIISQLINVQNSKVDVISGATCSSKALIALYQEAVKMARGGVE